MGRLICYRVQRSGKATVLFHLKRKSRNPERGRVPRGTLSFLLEGETSIDQIPEHKICMLNIHISVNNYVWKSILLQCLFLVHSNGFSSKASNDKSKDEQTCSKTRSLKGNNNLSNPDKLELSIYYYCISFEIFCIKMWKKYQIIRRKRLKIWFFSSVFLLLILILVQQHPSLYCNCPRGNCNTSSSAFIIHIYLIY